VHFGIETYRGHIAVKAPQRGENEMLVIAWPPHQASDAFDDVSTAEFDRVLVVVIGSHILESV
jgi:hypothetical protein